MKGKLKVAVVGCGDIAETRHIPAFLRQTKNVYIGAICDTNLSNAKKVSKKFNVPHVYQDIDMLLEKEEPDILDICTPPKTHAKIAIKALKLGCHVLVEKPMALSLGDCDEMIYWSKNCKRKLCVVHNQRFYPPVIQAQQLIKNGSIGKLTNINIVCSVPCNQYIGIPDHWINKLPGGPIEECGSHPIYLAIAFLGRISDVEVIASKTSSYPWVSLDNYNLQLTGNNISCHIINTYGGNYSAFSIDFIGTEGIMRIDIQSMTLVCSKGANFTPLKSSIGSSGIKLTLHTLNLVRQLFGNVLTNSFAVIKGKTFVSHNILIDKFVNSIINCSEIPVLPEEGKETIRVLEEIVMKLQNIDKTNLTLQIIEPLSV
jgi:2-alkyl-3-oxoalkanoate reductase